MCTHLERKDSSLTVADGDVEQLADMGVSVCPSEESHNEHRQPPVSHCLFRRQALRLHNGSHVWA
jgi:hypothetical protein